MLSLLPHRCLIGTTMLLCGYSDIYITNSWKKKTTAPSCLGHVWHIQTLPWCKYAKHISALGICKEYMIRYTISSLIQHPQPTCFLFLFTISVFCVLSFAEGQDFHQHLIFVGLPVNETQIYTNWDTSNCEYIWISFILVSFTYPILKHFIII